MTLPAGAQTSGTNEWTWMGGTVTTASFGVYGTLGAPAPENLPGARIAAVSWTDSNGNFWLFGGYGFDSVGTTGSLNDLWEFNPSSNQWVWMGGSNTLPNVLGSAPGVYGTLGTPAAGNIPPGRGSAVSWTDSNGKLWLFGGFASNGDVSWTLNDLWKFDPTTNEWTWMGGSDMTNQPGVYGTQGTPSSGNVPGARESSVSWIDSKGNFWLFGGQSYDSSDSATSYFNDLWKFNPSTSEWTWVCGANVANQAGVYGTLGKPAAGNVPAARGSSFGWIDASDNLWLFGGESYNDLWEFNTSTNLWAWMGGTDKTGQPGVYGTLGTASAGNVPGARWGRASWTDKAGNFWLYGGAGYDSAGTLGELGDLWEFNYSTAEWAWMGGASTVPSCIPEGYLCGPYPVYGSLQTPGLGNTPGDRAGSASWVDTKGNFWLFGGTGFDVQGFMGYESDLWEFQPNTNGQPVAATPAISPASGTYTAWQTVTITDTTPGSTITYTVNGSTPALEYTSPITVSSSETIEAIASASGYANSNIAMASYAANLPQAAAPTFSLSPGTYSTAQTVTLSDKTPGATIYYSIGLIPTTESFAAYSAPINVSASETIQAFAVADGYLNSAFATAAYNFGSNPPTAWTWMGGSSTIPSSCGLASCARPGWYGTLGSFSPENSPGSHQAGASWTDTNGNLWLFGGIAVDSAGNGGDLNDLWEFNPSTSEWAWMGGNSVIPCVSAGNCSGAKGIYGTLGTPSAANSPGGREYPSAWTDKNGHFWLFGGLGYDGDGNQGYLNDLWEFDPSTNKWTWMGGSNSVLTSTCQQPGADGLCGPLGVYGDFKTPAPENTPGGREQAMTWTDLNGNFWLYGGFGYPSWGAGNCLQDDLWEFNPTTTEWAWMNGNEFCAGAYGLPAVYGTAYLPGLGNTPGGIYMPVGWADTNANLWLFGGLTTIEETGFFSNATLQFIPSQGEWSWMSPDSFPVSDGGPVSSAMGTWSPQNIPGGRSDSQSWTDADGNFWLIGGQAIANNGFSGALNDFWEFKPSVNEWAWMGGGTGNAPAGVYGTLGMPSTANIPGGRFDGITWTDKGGNLWLFGGTGYDSQGTLALLNDMWQCGLKSAPAAVPALPAASPTFSLGAGTYTSAQTVTISDQTAGATIYYTTDGSIPSSVSPVYSGPITVSSTESIMAVAIGAGHPVSPLAAATYTINLPLTATPAFSVPAGTYTSAQTVSISDATSGAIIYYTTDGVTTPTTSSPKYSGAITVSSTETIQAIAVASNYANSTLASAAYVINLPQSFTITGTAVTVSPGAATGNSSTITLTPTNGFNGLVSLSCAITPVAANDPANCNIPASVTITGAALTTTLTVYTTPASSASNSTKGLFWPSTGGAALACILLVGIPARRRRWQRILGMVMLLFSLAGGAIACGGGGNGGGGGGGNSGTTPGNYTITVTGTSGSITQTGTVSLTVQ